MKGFIILPVTRTEPSGYEVERDVIFAIEDISTIENSTRSGATVTMKGGVKFHVNWSLTKIQELLEMGLMR